MFKHDKNSYYEQLLYSDPVSLYQILLSLLLIKVLNLKNDLTIEVKESKNDFVSQLQFFFFYRGSGKNCTRRWKWSWICMGIPSSVRLNFPLGFNRNLKHVGESRRRITRTSCWIVYRDTANTNTLAYSVNTVTLVICHIW